MTIFEDSALRKLIPPNLVGDWDRVLAGDANATCAFVRAQPAHWLRAQLALRAYENQIPLSGLRPIVEYAWVTAHSAVTNLVGLQYIRTMVTHCQYDLVELPDMVTAWRGTMGISAEEAADGLSWTTSRNTAIYHAMKGVTAQNQFPLLLRTSTSRRFIVFFSRKFGESEVIFSETPPFEIDGTEQEWKTIFDQDQINGLQDGNL
jgi:hypothetical protein